MIGEIFDRVYNLASLTSAPLTDVQTTLVPPGACPGHFDMKPSEARSVEECDLLLRHGFESFLPRSLPRSVRTLAVRPSENEMTPPGQAEAARSIAAAFAGMRPAWGAFFRARLDAYLAELDAAGRVIARDAEALGVRGVPVAVSVRLEPFFRTFFQYLAQEGQQAAGVVALREPLAVHDAAVVEHPVRVQEPVGGDQVHLRMGRPAGHQGLQDARRGALAHRHAAGADDADSDG